MPLHLLDILLQGISSPSYSRGVYEASSQRPSLNDLCVACDYVHSSLFTSLGNAFHDSIQVSHRKALLQYESRRKRYWLSTHHRYVVDGTRNSQPSNVAARKEDGLHCVGVRMQDYVADHSRVVKSLQRNLGTAPAQILQHVRLNKLLHHGSASAMSHGDFFQ